MTFNASHVLNRARHCVAMASELFTREQFISVAADGAATDQVRIATLLDTAAARLPETAEPAPDADLRAHVAARLLSHAGRLLAELMFKDLDAGETIAALVSAAVADLDALVRWLERRGGPDAPGAPA